MLNLEKVERINDQVIYDAAKNRIALISKIDKNNECETIRDVTAATLFLFDQWAYLTSYN